MNGQARTSTWALVVTLALSLSGAVPAAAPQQREPDPELDEVLVEGRKRVSKPQALIEWLERLVGRFVVDGTVNLHGSSSSATPQQVQGRADCTGFKGYAVFSSFNMGPVVRCELKIRWPETKGPIGEALLGGVSALNPARMMYAFERESGSINYLLVDSNGIAEGALGYLFSGDMLVSRTKCVNVPGSCERVVRITAEPDLKEVDMKIDLVVEGKKAVSFTFVMHRVPGSPRVIGVMPEVKQSP
jgi:hypothetical protein